MSSENCIRYCVYLDLAKCFRYFQISLRKIVESLNMLPQLQKQEYGFQTQYSTGRKIGNYSGQQRLMAGDNVIRRFRLKRRSIRLPASPSYVRNAT